MENHHSHSPGRRICTSTTKSSFIILTTVNLRHCNLSAGLEEFYLLLVYEPSVVPKADSQYFWVRHWHFMPELPHEKSPNVQRRGEALRLMWRLVSKRKVAVMASFYSQPYARRPSNVLLTCQTIPFPSFCARQVVVLAIVSHAGTMMGRI